MGGAVGGEVRGAMGGRVSKIFKVVVRAAAPSE